MRRVILAAAGLAASVVAGPSSATAPVVGVCGQPDVIPAECVLGLDALPGPFEETYESVYTSLNGPTSYVYPARRDVAGVVLRWQGIRSAIGGAIGVDLSMTDPDVNEGRPYLPCRNGREPYLRACANRDGQSYYAMAGFKPGLTKPFGGALVVDNGRPPPDTSCTVEECPSHEFANKTHRLDVEIYPKDANGVTDYRYLRLRFAVIDQFARGVGGKAYSPQIGVIRVPGLGDRGVVRLSGVIRRGPSPVGASQAYLSAFQAGVSTRSSTGWPTQSFAASQTASDGSYTTGALSAGPYRLTVLDKSTGTKCVFERRPITSTTQRLDFDLSKPRFGQRDGTCVQT